MAQGDAPRKGEKEMEKAKAEKYVLLPEDVPYYKANLHAHSTISDGQLSPGEAAKLYRSRGYSVLALTDHRSYVQHEELCSDDFIVLSSFEMDYNEPMENDDFSEIRTYHINFYDERPQTREGGKLPFDPPALAYGDKEALCAYVEQMREAGFLACYNHPYWSLQDCRDYLGLRGFWAMEIYNHGCELDGLYGYHPQSYDEMLRDGQRLFCVATDDNHNVYGPEDPRCDSFGGFVMIAAREFTYEGIFKALKEGSFYSSTGPQIRGLSLENGVLTVKCSPVQRIFVKTRGRDCHKALARTGETLTEASFRLDGTEGYIRVVCQDAHGRDACSNAYWLD